MNQKKKEKEKNACDMYCMMCRRRFHHWNCCCISYHATPNSATAAVVKDPVKDKKIWEVMRQISKKFSIKSFCSLTMDMELWI